MKPEQQGSIQRWSWIGLTVAVTIGVASCGFFTHIRPPGGTGGGGSGSDNGDGGSVDNNNNGSRDGGGGEVVVTDDGGTPPITKMSCGDKAYGDPWSPGYTPDPAVMTSVSQTLGGMSLSDKAGQMRGTNPGGNSNYSDIFRTPDNATKGIRGFLFRDGPRGVNLAAQLPAGKNGWSTSFPAPMARGAAFDMDLEYKIGQACGDETVGSGNTMLLAPTINILRHPAWGRSQETYGEDPYLLGRIGTAFVAGVQEYVPACVKHYAANNIENGRGSINSQMDEQTLREIYARHFEMLIKDGGVACVMAAYNLVNGKKSTQNKHLLNEILRDDFGFRGFVLSDWWAMPPGTAASSTDALAANAAEAIQAGMDMELPWSYNYQQVEAITGTGKPIQESAITASASRILEQKFRFKVAKMGQPIGLKTATSTLSAQGSLENINDHIAIAHRAAVESMVLLKNDNNTLPIDRSKVKKVAVIGANVSYAVVNTDQATGTVHFATDVRLGDLGSSRVFADPAKSSGPFAGIQAIAGSGVSVTSGADASLADSADFVVVVAGLTPEDEGEEYTRAGDRPNFALDGKKATPTQNPLIAAVAAKHKPMVVVLEGGSVIDMPWLGDVPAVVMAWYPGMDGGKALGELLFGDANFSGKLPITWPKSWNDEPVFNAGATTVMDYDIGYRRFDRKGIAPLFPFGFGLSYTKFTYKNLQVPCSDVTHGGVVDVQVDITNSGTVKGDEVSFLFVSYPDTTQRRPIKELKGFRRTTLEPGQTKRITMQLRVSDLKYFDGTGNKWGIENGTVKIMVGGSSADLPVSDTMVVK
jgi:beta-glucosidase